MKHVVAFISTYLFLVISLVRNSHRRWFLQIRKQMVRLMCSYQAAMDAPNAISGHTRLGANFLIKYCVPCSPFGTGKYGCHFGFFFYTN